MQNNFIPKRSSKSPQKSWRSTRNCFQSITAQNHKTNSMVPRKKLKGILKKKNKSNSKAIESNNFPKPNSPYFGNKTDICHTPLATLPMKSGKFTTNSGLKDHSSYLDASKGQDSTFRVHEISNSFDDSLISEDQYYKQEQNDAQTARSPDQHAIHQENGDFGSKRYIPKDKRWDNPTPETLANTGEKSKLIHEEEKISKVAQKSKKIRNIFQKMQPENANISPDLDQDNLEDPKWAEFDSLNASFEKQENDEEISVQSIEMKQSKFDEEVLNNKSTTLNKCRPKDYKAPAQAYNVSKPTTKKVKRILSEHFKDLHEGKVMHRSESYRG